MTSRIKSALTIKLQDSYIPMTHSNEETPLKKWWHKWLVKVIFGLWNEKKKILANMGFPPQPIHQKEICREVSRRIEMLKEMDIWGITKQYPYSKTPDHNWVERRVNYIATEEYAPKTDSGIIKIVNYTAGYYGPNPKLFTGKCQK